MIILVQHTYEWRGYEWYGTHRGKETVAHPSGLKDAIKAGAKIVEAVGVSESKTGGSECYYAQYRVDFPDELIPDLMDGKFECLVSLVPIPEVA